MSMSKTRMAKTVLRKITRGTVPHQKQGFTSSNRARLVHGGKEFFSYLKKLIDSARHTIHFQTYIFSDDKTGTFIANALIEAAKRKVQVFLLVDGFASQSLSKEFIQNLKDEGIRFRFFQPLLRSKYFYFGRRLHHKVVVVDGIKAIVGSQNIADRYNDLPKDPAWLDLAMYVEGEAALELHWICSSLWAKRRSKFFEPPDGVKHHIASIPKEEHCSVAIRRNDWVYGKSQAYRTYSRLFGGAKKSISIVCSYFLPGRSLMNRLKNAVRRGVKVRVVLAGVSDVKTAKYAERYLYRWLIRNKIHVYEYQPTVLHAKSAVVDNSILTVGSYNLNDLSNYASIELNLVADNKRLATLAQEDIDRIIENDCQVIDLSTFDTRLLSFRQFLQWGAFQFLRFMVTLTTFYFKRKE